MLFHFLLVSDNKPYHLLNERSKGTGSSSTSDNKSNQTNIITSFMLLNDP